jgi:hypothetical protein
MKMLEAFLTSFRLKNTYKTNGIIYSLKSIPIIKKLLPVSLYGSPGLKKFANIVSVLWELISIFLGKLLYLLLMIFLLTDPMKSGSADSFVHMFFFLTVAGGFLNTQIFDPAKDKYYAIILMRMSAREYTLSNYFYFLLKMLVGFLPFTLLFGTLSGVHIVICLVMPLFVISAKLIFTALALRNYARTGRTKNENLPAPVVWAGAGVSLVAAYLPPFLGYAMNGAAFFALFIAAAIGAVFSFSYVLKFREYRGIYKRLLTADSFAISRKDMAAQAAQKSYQKKMDLEATSSKNGYKYFNDLFVKRHSRLLTKSAKRITLISLAALVLSIAACFLFPKAKSEINGLMLTFLPYFLFVMYLVNRGKVITQAMFMNCDHSMLTYRFYRQPRALLLLFTERLKSIILINLMPAAVIALALPLLLWLTGGTDNPFNYVLLFVSIIAMSVFFSVHNMILYYLLQPYNVNLEMKSSIFTIVNTLTYVVCYIAIGKEVPTLIFGTLISAFCIVYIAVALILAYRLAPKTFKLRQ